MRPYVDSWSEDNPLAGLRADEWPDEAFYMDDDVWAEIWATKAPTTAKVSFPDQRVPDA